MHCPKCDHFFDPYRSNAANETPKPASDEDKPSLFIRIKNWLFDSKNRDDKTNGAIARIKGFISSIFSLKTIYHSIIAIYVVCFFGMIGLYCYKDHTTESAVIFCRIRVEHVKENEIVYHINGIKKYDNDLYYGKYNSFDEAFESSKKLNCTKYR